MRCIQKNELVWMDGRDAFSSLLPLTSEETPLGYNTRHPSNFLPCEKCKVIPQIFLNCLQESWLSSLIKKKKTRNTNVTTQPLTSTLLAYYPVYQKFSVYNSKFQKFLKMHFHNCFHNYVFDLSNRDNRITDVNPFIILRQRIIAVHRYNTS